MIQINASPSFVWQSHDFCEGKLPCRNGPNMIRTGEIVSAGKGERLPAAPLGYRWRLVAVDEPLEVARRHVLEAERRVARQESLIQQMERKGHVEIAKMGRTLLRAMQTSLRAAHDYVERLQEFPH